MNGRIVTVVRHHCPVDVEVYTADGQLAGRVADNTPEELLPDKVAVVVNGDQKDIFLLDAGEQYTFRLTGTDDGTMEYSVENIDVETWETVGEKSFHNVSLFAGKRMTSEISSDVETGVDVSRVQLLVLDENGNAVKEVLPDGSGTEVPLAPPETPENPENPDVPDTPSQPVPDYGGVEPGDVPADGKIPEGIWTAGIKPLAYTGTAVKQSFRIYDSRTLLQEGRDYTVSYKNNTKAYVLENSADPSDTDRRKAPRINIKMKGNYSGSQTVYFSITPLAIDGANFSVSDMSVIYNGKKQTPTPSLFWNGRKLKLGTDFYVKEYEAEKKNKNAFKGARDNDTAYSLTLAGRGNFSGERKVTLTLAGAVADGREQALLGKAAATKIPEQKYTGSEITLAGLKAKNGGALAFALTYKKKALKEGVDYEVTGITGNREIGTAVVTLRGLRSRNSESGYSFAGEKTITFRIVGTNISRAKVTGLGKSYAYTGEEIRPEAALSGIDASNYTVTWRNNRDAGTAEIIFTGINACVGTKKATFRISGYPMDGAKIRVNDGSGGIAAVYRKGGARPDLTVTYGERTLVEGTDYTLKYANNRQMAEASAAKAPTVTIKGRGDFGGSRQVKFSVIMADIARDVTMRADDVAESAKAGRYRTKVTLLDADGKALKAGQDYDWKNAGYYVMEEGVWRELTAQDRPAAGTAITVKVRGMGNYGAGEISAEYRILAVDKDIRNGVFQIENQPYTGSPILITKQEQFKKDKNGSFQAYRRTGKSVIYLTLGKDFEIVEDSYQKNIEKGKASVTLHGIGEYGGYKTVTFNIGTRSLKDWWKGIFGGKQD